MNFSLYIAKRYLFSKTSNNAINIITIIASFGVIVGSLALFIILSGFSGLRTFSYSLLEASDPDIKITSAKGKSFVFTKDVAAEGSVTMSKEDGDKDPLDHTSVPDETWIDHFVDGIGDANSAKADSVFMKHETEGTATKLKEVNDKKPLSHTSVVPDEAWMNHFVGDFANEKEYDSQEVKKDDETLFFT